jgi:hypothetical protein
MRPPRNSILRSSAILDLSEAQFLSPVGFVVRKIIAQYDGRQSNSFRLHRFEDVALLTDG